MSKSEFQTFISSINVSKAIMLDQEEKHESELKDMTDEVFKKYDSNGDGNLSLDEFKTFFCKEKSVRDYLSICGLVTSEDIEEIDKHLSNDFDDDDDLTQELKLKGFSH